MGDSGSVRWTAWVLGAAVLVAIAPPASAFEFFEGRVELHGFYEAQIRSLVRDFDLSDDWDLTQWYNVLNLELEADLAPGGLGPFDLLSLFGRVEVRYDCVWTRGCGLFPTADTYGRRSRRGRLPKRLIDGRRSGYTLQLYTGDTSHYHDRALEPEGYVGGSRKPLNPDRTPGFEILYGINPIRSPFVFEPIADCLFGALKVGGTSAGNGSRVVVHSVDERDCDIEPMAELGAKPNPFRGAWDLGGNPRPDGGDLQEPQIPGSTDVGFGELPLRPAPILPATARGAPARAQGIWYPNAGVSKMLRDGEFDTFDQNYREREELAWNRGASQQDTKELKELYLDVEMFDSRLWLRIGKQQIVWGKTELFRTTDQFNPQDLALGSLTSLEESRIALFGFRGIWSFYDVGPLNDLRLELVATLQDFEPADLGRCGEPYTPLPVCDKTFGLMAHGVNGNALAGEIRPPDLYDSLRGWEGGARVEFRWGRFSFALIDFYGYADTPYVEQVFTYSRNVDPLTGRPRHTTATGACGRVDVDGNGLGDPVEANCLIGGVLDAASGRLGIAGMPARFQFPASSLGLDSLRFHSVNQQNYALICSTSVGFSELDRGVCAQSVFNSLAPALGDPAGPTIGTAISNLIAGDLFQLVLSGLVPGLPVNPLVALARDPRDGPFVTVADAATVFNPTTGTTGIGGTDAVTRLLYNTGLQGTLTNEQEALLGCGPFYGTFCDVHGVDLLNMEASALMQSWPGFEGTSDPWDTRDASKPQPGTEGFQGGEPCTRYEGGQLFILPGCRGPNYQNGTVIGGVEVRNSPYNPAVDGTTTGPNAVGLPVGARVHPFTGQPFRSEMAVVSWNMLIFLTALSSLGADPANPTRSQFSVLEPFRTDGCSFARPIFCSNVAAFQSVTGVQRNTVRAGGGYRFGRRDFTWHGGAGLVLRYHKRNVAGLSLDFAEDVTKTNWGVEFTWIPGLPTGNADEVDGLSDTDEFNLTIAVDRPTFINFLNQNRTFFITTQWFLQYRNDWEKSNSGSGPFNVLAILNVSTGYFQDRLSPAVTFIYDFRSNSSGVLPSIGYRFTENFSATFGAALFAGRIEKKTTALTSLSLGNRVGPGGYKAHVENGLAVIRERDELFLRVRYTF